MYISIHNVINFIYLTLFFYLLSFCNFLSFFFLVIFLFLYFPNNLYDSLTKLMSLTKCEQNPFFCHISVIIFTLVFYSLISHIFRAVICLIIIYQTIQDVISNINFPKCISVICQFLCTFLYLKIFFLVN